MRVCVCVRAHLTFAARTKDHLWQTRAIDLQDKVWRAEIQHILCVLLFLACTESSYRRFLTDRNSPALWGFWQTTWKAAGGCWMVVVFVFVGWILFILVFSLMLKNPSDVRPCVSIYYSLWDRKAMYSLQTIIGTAMIAFSRLGGDTKWMPALHISTGSPKIFCQAMPSASDCEDVNTKQEKHLLYRLSSDESARSGSGNSTRSAVSHGPKEHISVQHVKKQEHTTMQEKVSPRIDVTDYYPDGGWGWVVVAAATLVHVLCSGFHFAFGALFLEIQQQFNTKDIETGKIKEKVVWFWVFNVTWCCAVSCFIILYIVAPVITDIVTVSTVSAIVAMLLYKRWTGTI